MRSLASMGLSAKKMTTVDDALFDSLQAAIDFVAALGGGIVFTALAGTLFAKSLKVPETVKLLPERGKEG